MYIIVSNPLHAFNAWRRFKFSENSWQGVHYPVAI